MALSKESIKKIYTRTLAVHYDQKIAASFEMWRAAAVGASRLGRGNRVIVFCCGTGHDFPHLIDKIGEEGEIVGMDFSPQMLAGARARIDQQGWRNIRLVEADATLFANTGNDLFDAGLCTLGISIIPEYRQAYDNLCSFVRPGGEIIIGDLQLAHGWRSIFNPLIIRLAREYGGSFRGHRNSSRLFAAMQEELSDIRSGEFYHRSYKYVVGKKQSTA